MDEEEGNIAFFFLLMKSWGPASEPLVKPEVGFSKQLNPHYTVSRVFSVVSMELFVKFSLRWFVQGQWCLYSIKSYESFSFCSSVCKPKEDATIYTTVIIK